MKQRISIPDLHWYAAQLMFIPMVLDRPAGRARCREIGEAILREFDHQAMISVCEFVRDQFDRSAGRAIETAWDGIGEWLG